MRNSLLALTGVQAVAVDYDLAEAIVDYVPGLVQVAAMIKATTDVGFPSSLKAVKQESQ